MFQPLPFPTSRWSIDKSCSFMWDLNAKGSSQNSNLSSSTHSLKSCKVDRRQHTGSSLKTRCCELDRPYNPNLLKTIISVIGDDWLLWFWTKDISVAWLEVSCWGAAWPSVGVISASKHLPSLCENNSDQRSLYTWFPTWTVNSMAICKPCMTSFIVVRLALWNSTSISCFCEWLSGVCKNTFK